MSIYPIYIDSTTSGSQLSIGTVNTSTILLGNTNSSTTVNGLLSVSNINTNSINPISSDLSIGNLQTIGVLNLGTGLRTGTINIGSSSATGEINIQTSGTMLIGNVTATAFTTRDIRINGTDTSLSRIYQTNIGSFRFRNGADFNELNITDQTSTGYIAIADRQNIGELRIGGGAGVTRTGSIRIGCQTGNNCAIDIYTANDNTTRGSVNIANGTQQTTPVNIAANTGTGLVTIGNSANTTTIASETLNITGNLTLTKPIILSYTDLVDIKSFNIGYTAYRYFPGIIAMTSGNGYSSYDILLPAGVYIGQLTFIPSYSDISPGSTTFDGFSWTVQSETTNSISSTVYYDAHIRNNMIYGIGETYPNITLGTLTFILSEEIYVYAKVTPKFRTNDGSAGMYINTDSGTDGTKFTITRIG